MDNFSTLRGTQPNDFCVLVVNQTGSHHFESFDVAKANYTTLDPMKNTKDFTCAMYNGTCTHHDKPQMRFEDWHTNDQLSR